MKGAAAGIETPRLLLANSAKNGGHMSGLKIDDVSMTFELPNGGKVEALKNINLDIKEGELMSVLGPSGCGKTTLLNILAGFLAPTGGQTMLGGNVVSGPSSLPSLASALTCAK